MHSNPHPEACGCKGYGGAGGPTASFPRAHNFCECPVARAVVRQTHGYLAGPLYRAHTWLGDPPEDCLQGPWDVVAMAALTAMEKGRSNCVQLRS